MNVNWIFPLRTFEASRNVQLGKLEDRALFRAVPWQRKSVDMPWKNPYAIRLANILDRQLVAKADDIPGVIKVILEHDPFGKFIILRIGKD